MSRNRVHKALHEAGQHLYDAQNKVRVPVKSAHCDCVVKTNFKIDSISIEKLQRFLTTL